MTHAGDDVLFTMPGFPFYKCSLNHQSAVSLLWLDLRADGTSTCMESDWFSIFFLLQLG